MRVCLLGLFLAAGAAGCARSSGQSEVPASPVPRDGAGVSLAVGGPRGKVAPPPGPQAVPDMKVKQLP